MFKTATWHYKVFVGILVTIGLTFSFGGLILTHSQGVKSTKVGASIQNGNEHLIFKAANYYKKSQLLEVEFVYEGNLSNANEELQITTFNAATGQKIKAKLEQINLNYYVVFVPDLSDFKQILIEFGTRTINENEDKTLQTISLTPKNSQIKGTFKPKTLAYYDAHYISALVKEANTRITQLQKQNVSHNADIKNFQAANRRLKTQFAYQTKSEQEQTQSEIADNQSQIKSLQEQIQSEENSIQGPQDKIKMLEKDK